MSSSAQYRAWERVESKEFNRALYMVQWPIGRLQS